MFKKVQILLIMFGVILLSSCSNNLVIEEKEEGYSNYFFGESYSIREFTDTSDVVRVDIDDFSTNTGIVAISGTRTKIFEVYNTEEVEYLYSISSENITGISNLNLKYLYENQVIMSANSLYEFALITLSESGFSVEEIITLDENSRHLVYGFEQYVLFTNTVSELNTETLMNEVISESISIYDLENNEFIYDQVDIGYNFKYYSKLSYQDNCLKILNEDYDLEEEITHIELVSIDLSETFPEPTILFEYEIENVVTFDFTETLIIIKPNHKEHYIIYDLSLETWEKGYKKIIYPNVAYNGGGFSNKYFIINNNIYNIPKNLEKGLNMGYYKIDLDNLSTNESYIDIVFTTDKVSNTYVYQLYVYNPNNILYVSSEGLANTSEVE